MSRNAQTKNDINDAFDGIDDSAFLSIDENAVMAKYEASKSLSPEQKTMNSNKRQRKRTVENPYHKAPSKQIKNASPFGEDSMFTTGTTVNYEEYNWSSKPRSISSSTTPPTLSKAELEKIEGELQQTLQKYYGFDTFRDGQYEIISSLLHPTHAQDCAVFWATGSGKSLCYQLPALHTNKTAIIISPLISLMQDQVNKLNGSTATTSTKSSLNQNQKIANYLGSAQTDKQVLPDVLQGKYKIVYCTPELLVANNGNLFDQFYAMAMQDKISLIAIDEAHCVSEWGNDFRPDYRQIGKNIQKRPNLKVPLLALTATATPRVRQDIIDSLRLRSPKLSVHSFDRDNLQISIYRKPPNHYIKAFQPLIKTIKAEKSKSHSLKGGSSTIIYVPSKSLADEISNFLSDQFNNNHDGDDNHTNIRVQPYHAGLSLKQREDHHTNFLIGKTDIIVATIAFGMGIDKPDTRRVYHYGPPKTMEEYYQQIGRAGRDGLPAECVMWANDSDFSKYASDFYTSSLTADAKHFVEQSRESLRKFAMDVETCRRATLLHYFSEEPPFGEFCGTCDVCLNRKKYSDIDLYRDFRSEGATIILLAAQSLKESSLSFLEKVIGGKTVENYRYYPSYNPEEVKESILEARSKMNKKRPLSFFKELIPSLVSKGYMETSIKKGGGVYKITWSAYSITPKGLQALNNPNMKINLPVPPSLRQIEAEEEEKRKATLSNLHNAGINLSTIPKQELDNGDGEVIAAHKRWLSHLDTLKKTGRMDRLEQLEDLRRRIEFWRSHTAEKLRMAPAAVMSDHLLVSVAYVSASSPKPVIAEALEATGVRSAGLNDLVDTLQIWWEETNPGSTAQNSMDSMNRNTSLMTFPEKHGNFILSPEKPWEFAIYKPNKKTGKAAWESSYNRFHKGEHPQTIAMNPENGRPIQVNTVVGHIFTALIHGRPVPLQRLCNVVDSPTRSDWERLREAELTTELDVAKNPSVSMTELMRPIMGDLFVDQPRENRTKVQSEEFSKWCRHLTWYMALRRVNYEPRFEPDDKIALDTV